jgi:hypothetical protein
MHKLIPPHHYADSNRFRQLWSNGCIFAIIKEPTSSSPKMMNEKPSVEDLTKEKWRLHNVLCYTCVYTRIRTYCLVTNAVNEVLLTRRTTAKSLSLPNFVGLRACGTRAMRTGDSNKKNGNCLSRSRWLSLPKSLVTMPMRGAVTGIARQGPIAFALRCTAY